MDLYQGGAFDAILVERLVLLFHNVFSTTCLKNWMFQVADTVGSSCRLQLQDLLHG